MTETEAVFTLQGVLLVLCLWRRPQRIMLALAVAWLIGIAVGGYWPADRALPPVIALDAAVIAVMGWLYRKYDSDRALIVMWLGALKVVWEIAAVALIWPQHFRAAGINGGFIVQVLVGGGLADGVMAWVGYSARRVSDRLHRILAGV